ncbi:hypothetical protein NDU88_002383 [Pleurodeles waltl]|uniref:Uncharacterized protein n=1 Tax=Pleurodeles waltl TaxID=8319 RepID=A0AAV7M804_PLEWA|nr:hypothetical protein NDU88_002383 [Pleurodeles waltl]
MAGFSNVLGAIAGTHVHFMPENSGTGKWSGESTCMEPCRIPNKMSVFESRYRRMKERKLSRGLKAISAKAQGTHASRTTRAYVSQTNGYLRAGSGLGEKARPQELYDAQFGDGSVGDGEVPGTSAGCDVSG